MRIVLPTDIVVDTAFPSGDRDPEPQVVSVDGIPDDSIGLDIGPESGRAFAQVIAGAATVFWNGPMGVFETPAFADGTQAVAQALTEVTAKGGLSVVGGGDSAAAVAAGMPPDAVTASESSDAAAELIVSWLAPGDLVLVKGSRGIKTDAVVDRIAAEFA